MPVGAVLVILGVLGQAAAGDRPPTPVRVGRVQEPKKLKHVAPNYPDEARRAGLAQDVVLECVVDPRGSVGTIDALQGVSPLTEAAIKAVKQWRYEPTLLDGAPVPVIMKVTVRFSAQQADYHDLLGSLESENEHIRAAAARNLGVLRVGGSFDEGDRKRAIRELERLAAEDVSRDVRGAAARSLTRLDGRPLPPELRPPPPARTTAAALPTPALPRPVAWGLFVDPLGECGVTTEGDRIQVDVPAREGEPSVEQGQERAPRLMKPVVGDFEAEVRVGLLPEPGLRRRAFHSAGLLLRRDDRTLVRLESALVRDAATPKSRSVRYVLFEARLDGTPADLPAGLPVTLKHAPTDLRLERRGTQVLALVSQEGAPWREVARVTLALPEAMEIGVTVANTAGTPLAASLQGFVVSPADDLAADRPILPPAPIALPDAPVDAELPKSAPPARPVSAESPGRAPDAEGMFDAPPRVLKNVRPEYPQDAYKNKVEGTVLIEAVIDTEGRVVSTRVLESVPGLDEAAVAALEQWRFSPARKGGKPVAVVIHMPVAFRIY